METTTRPLFVLYVVWHPSYTKGYEVSDLLRRHFGDDRYRNVAGGSGISVIYRNKSAPDSHTPLQIDWEEADTTAAIVLVDSALASDSAWLNYVFELSQSAQTRGFLTRLFPVLMEAEGFQFQLEEQALRWNRLGKSDVEREQQLVSNLTYQFSRMLRHRLDLLRRPEASNAPLSRYLEKIQVFISHSKHDNDGEAVARSIRNWLHDNIALSSFFDVFDIPTGLSFREVLLHQIETSVLVAIHTDSYSSREWCRREVIEAKRRHVPMIIVDCLRDIDQRAIPYMGNVPIVRMGVERQDRINTAIGCLLDEVFRTYLWRCRVEPFREAHSHVLFTARPPELISLATLPEYESKASSAIVYPEPPLGADEARLFSEIASGVRTRTLTEWLAEIQ
ncbi:MAG: toll/interleukin-1 receptor domain-containing protein [Nitrospira sp.]|nr:toll/interleukin-1 receptor domain-containing protein [Nitrospira sp.]MCY4132107.1 toll/interleukin-1 receptor domain-containing protein [Nitrospira sp.]